MRLTVIGAGYLGLTHAVCMADLGHHVLALDVDAEKVARAARAETPFFEPGLQPLLRKNLDAGRLRFTGSWQQVARFGKVHFVCVGTPSGVNGAADLSYVHAAVNALAPMLTGRCLVVGKSTVPVGTARQLLARLRAATPAGPKVELAWNPEFLSEGEAVQGSLAPDRVVLGVTSDWAADLLKRVYAPLLAANVPALVMDLETAELVKISANAFLATKISFINAMAEVCEAVGADVLQLAEALRHDERIGARYLSPGLGFGGGCLPKDIRAFGASAKDWGLASVTELLRCVDAINLSRRARVVELARDLAGGSLTGVRIAALGVAFKPGSDDVRDSPSLDVCSRLVSEGAQVSVHDPAAMPTAAKVRPGLRYARSLPDAAAGADLVMLLTDWADYRMIDPDVLKDLVARPRIVDARCVLDCRLWKAAGWAVRVPGQGLTAQWLGAHGRM